MGEISYGKEIKAIKNVTNVGDYNLLLEFTNGEKRIFNAASLFEKPVFEPLKNPEFFNTVHIVYDYTIGWDDNIDMCPDCLYRDSIAF